MIETEARYFAKWLKERVGLGPEAVPGDDNYYFLHINKTAGMSLLFALYEHFPYRQIQPDFVNFFKPWVRSYISNPRILKERAAQLQATRTRIVAAHVRVPFAKTIIGTDPRILTMVRDPRRRLVSHILFDHREQGKGADFKTIAEREDRRIYRVQSHLLGYDYARDNLGQVAANLQQFDFVGLTEEYERSIRLCNKVFGWQLRSDIRKNSATMSTAQDRAAVEQVVDNDLLVKEFEVYELAKARFYALCAQHGIA